MADRIVKVSDLTGEILDEEHLARLVVEGYPELQGAQITLDVLPSEVEGEIPEDGDLVVLSYYPPGATAGRRFFMERTDFEKLASGSGMDQVLATARNAQSLEAGPRRRGRRRAQASPTEKINYASPEHAGEPHRGRATEKEKEYVRAHLSEVNARLSRGGHRTIDPKDPKMAERYGLDAEQAVA